MFIKYVEKQSLKQGYFGTAQRGASLLSFIHHCQLRTFPASSQGEMVSRWPSHVVVCFYASRKFSRNFILPGKAAVETWGCLWPHIPRQTLKF